METSGAPLLFGINRVGHLESGRVPNWSKPERHKLSLRVTNNGIEVRRFRGAESGCRARKPLKTLGKRLVTAIYFGN
jgi:hypothetical protein